METQRFRTCKNRYGETDCLETEIATNQMKQSNSETSVSLKIQTLRVIVMTPSVPRNPLQDVEQRFDDTARLFLISRLH
jgi:hypothetical protein